MKTAAKLMLCLVLACQLLMPVAVVMAQTPDATIKMPRGSITLQQTPCTDAKVIALLNAEFVPQFRQAKVVWDGKPLAACWAIDPAAPSFVFLIDETGDNGMIPLKAFKPAGIQI